MAATAAWGAGAALGAAVAPFLEAAVAAVADAVAAAAVGAAAAAAVSPVSARAGPLTTMARFLRSLVQAVLLLFSLFRLRALVRCLASRWSAVSRLPWARVRGGMGVSEMSLGGLQEKSKRSRPGRVSNFLKCVSTGFQFNCYAIFNDKTLNYRHLDHFFRFVNFTEKNLFYHKKTVACKSPIVLSDL